MLLVEIECALHSSSCWNWDDELYAIAQSWYWGWNLNENAMYKVHMVAECAVQAECAHAS